MFDDWIRFNQGFIIISPLGSYSNVCLTIISAPTFGYKYENAWYILQDSRNKIIFHLNVTETNINVLVST